MPRKEKKFDRNEYQRDYMRTKRKENPDYGKSPMNRVTIAYCRQCKEERHWIDAKQDEDGVFLCPVCGQALYTLREQPGTKKEEKPNKEYARLARRLLGPDAEVLEADSRHIKFKRNGKECTMGITLRPKVKK